VAAVKKALEGDDAAAIRSAQDELARTSHKLAEAMYAKTSGQQPGAGPGAGPEAGPKAAGGKKDDNVVDAEFEENK
jgi:molecular chaperone DnaK